MFRKFIDARKAAKGRTEAKTEPQLRVRALSDEDIVNYAIRDAKNKYAKQSDSTPAVRREINSALNDLKAPLIQAMKDNTLIIKNRIWGHLSTLLTNAIAKDSQTEIANIFANTDASIKFDTEDKALNTAIKAFAKRIQEINQASLLQELNNLSAPQTPSDDELDIFAQEPLNEVDELLREISESKEADATITPTSPTSPNSKSEPVTPPSASSVDELMGSDDGDVLFGDDKTPTPSSPKKKASQPQSDNFFKDDDITPENSPFFEGRTQSEETTAATPHFEEKTSNAAVNKDEPDASLSAPSTVNVTGRENDDIILENQKDNPTLEENREMPSDNSDNSDNKAKANSNTQPEQPAKTSQPSQTDRRAAARARQVEKEAAALKTRLEEVKKVLDERDQPKQKNETTSTSTATSQRSVSPDDYNNIEPVDYRNLPDPDEPVRGPYNEPGADIEQLRKAVAGANEQQAREAAEEAKKTIPQVETTTAPSAETAIPTAQTDEIQQSVQSESKTTRKPFTAGSFTILRPTVSPTSSHTMTAASTAASLKTAVEGILDLDGSKSLKDLQKEFLQSYDALESLPELRKAMEPIKLNFERNDISGIVAMVGDLQASEAYQRLFPATVASSALSSTIPPSGSTSPATSSSMHTTIVDTPSRSLTPDPIVSATLDPYNSSTSSLSHGAPTYMPPTTGSRDSSSGSSMPDEKSSPASTSSSSFSASSSSARVAPSLSAEAKAAQKQREDEKLVSDILRDIERADVGERNQARFLADFAITRGNLDETLETVNSYISDYGLHEERKEIKDISNVAELASNKLQNQITHIIPTIADRMDLPRRPDDIKQITDFAMRRNNENSAMREDIVNIKEFLGGTNLDNLQYFHLKSEHVLNDQATIDIRNGVTTKLQQLMLNLYTTHFSPDINNLNILTFLATKSIVEIQEAIKNDSTLKQHLGFNDFDNNVFANDRIIHPLIENIKHQAGVQLNSIINNTLQPMAERAILDQPLGNNPESKALAELATSRDPRVTLYNLRNSLAPTSGLNRFADASQIPLDLARHLQTKAQERISQEITRTLPQKIRDLPPAEHRSKELLDALSEAKTDTATLSQAFEDNQDLLGLQYLTQEQMQKPEIVSNGLWENLRLISRGLQLPNNDEEKVCVAALNQLQEQISRDPAPITPGYIRVKEELWGKNKVALLALANDETFKRGKSPQQLSSTLATFLKTLFSYNPAKPEAEIKTALGISAPGLDDGLKDQIAATISAANLAESQAQLVKSHAATLANQLEQIEQKHAKVTLFLSEAERTFTAMALPPGSDMARDRLAKVDEVRAELMKLEALRRDARTAHQKTENLLPKIRSGEISTVDAVTQSTLLLTTAQNPPGRGDTALNLAEAASVAATNAHARAVSQPVAKDPNDLFLQLPPVIKDRVNNPSPIAATALQNKNELIRCENLIELYRTSVFFKMTAEHHADVENFAQIDSVINQINLAITDGSGARGIQITGPINAAISIASDEGREWLQKMLTELQILKAELVHIKKHHENSYNGVSVYSSHDESFTDIELGQIQELSPAAFNDWRTNALKGRVGPAGGADPLMDARNTSSASRPQIIPRDTAAPKVYRKHPPGDAKPEDTIFYEEESKRLTGTISRPDYRLVVLDLPESISDRGALVKFLMDKGATFYIPNPSYDPNDPNSSPTRPPEKKDFHNLVFSKLDPALDERTVLNFLKTHVQTPATSRNTRLASEFMNSGLTEHRNELIRIPKQFRSLENPNTVISLSQYLAYTGPDIGEREKFAPVKEFMPKTVLMPKQAFFAEAASILNTLLARGQLPITIKNAKSPELMIAIDCLAKIRNIPDAKIIFPNNAKRATDDQVLAAKRMGCENIIKQPTLTAETIEKNTAEIVRTMRP